MWPRHEAELTSPARGRRQRAAAAAAAAAGKGWLAGRGGDRHGGQGASPPRGGAAITSACRCKMQGVITVKKKKKKKPVLLAGCPKPKSPHGSDGAVRASPCTDVWKEAAAAVFWVQISHGFFSAGHLRSAMAAPCSGCSRARVASQ